MAKANITTATAGRFPDPGGMIARARASLKPNCQVRKSPYCDQIIAMRMQAVSYRDIETFLGDQGTQYTIPSATIHRNFKSCKLAVSLTKAEEMAEQWGGGIDLDLVREMMDQALIQKKRIDHLVRHEGKKQLKDPGYSDRRIGNEMLIFQNLVKVVEPFLQTPDEGLASLHNGDVTIELNEDAEALIVSMLLNGDMSYSVADTSKDMPKLVEPDFDGGG